MDSFKNKVVVITGAGNGIGRALAQNLASKGAKLALNSRTESNLMETIESLNIDSNYVFHSAFDISKKEHVFEFAEQVKKQFGQVDVLINNAGVAISGLTFEELDVKDFDWIFSVNFMGVINSSKAFLPLLKENKNPTTLVNLSSIFGLVPMALKTPYSATKHAITGFTNCLRMELENTNVNVIGVHPGGVKTGITVNALKAEQEPEYTKEFNKKLKMAPEKAAELIVNGILKRKKNMVIGSDAKIALLAHKFFPFVLKGIAKKTMAAFKS